MSEQVWWYATRATGLMTLSTAWASVLIGLVLSMRLKKGRSGPWVNELHRFLGGVTVVFLGGHLISLWLESSIPFSWAELVAPGTSDWDVMATTVGVIAAWSLVAVEVTSILRSRISDRVWRVSHRLSLVTAGAGTYHAVLGGTDVENAATWILAGAGSGLIVALSYARIGRVEEESPTGATAAERESVLIEMRQRLESLPASISALSLELALDDAPALPRRGTDAPPPAPNFDPAAPAAVPPIAIDPYDSVAPPNDAPELGSWIIPSTNDPFAGGYVDPFRNNTFPTDANAPAEVATEPPNPFSSDTNGPSPFARADLASPFGSEVPPSPPLGAPIDASGAGERESHSDLFGPATAAEAAASELSELPQVEAGINPFRPIEPTATAISISPTIPDGPPPLPESHGSSSDAPDEAAYTAWLVEWLAYAERYGDETPDDPNRF